MRYKNVQYWILWYPIFSWTDYMLQIGILLRHVRSRIVSMWLQTIQWSQFSTWPPIFFLIWGKKRVNAFTCFWKVRSFARFNLKYIFKNDRMSWLKKGDFYRKNELSSLKSAIEISHPNFPHCNFWTVFLSLSILFNC